MFAKFKPAILVTLVLSLPLSLNAIAPAKAMTKTVSASTCGWDSSSGWVQRENLLSGTPSWANGIALEYSGDYGAPEKLSAGQTFSAKSVDGWLDAASAKCGDVIGLHLTGNGKPIKVKVFRMGYYKGAGARLIQTFTTQPIPLLKFQVSPAPKSTVTTNWPVAWNFKVTNATKPGQYLFRLDDGGSDASFVPLTILNPQAKSDITLVSSVLTWQSYNQWGGYSLYKGPNRLRATKANIVSFKRPYDGAGDGQFRYMEYPLLKLAEQLGLNMNYITDLELNKDASSLANTSSIILGGHAEYWTTQMRTSLQSALDRGVNLVSFGGNELYNRPRYVSSTREVIMWRGSTSDPARSDPIWATTVWRSPPINQPESLLLGTQYVGLGVDGNYLIVHPDRWPFNTERHPNMLANIVGREVDSPLYAPGPAVETLASAQIIFNGKKVTTMATYYTNASGAGIVGIGTNGWTCAIDNICPWHPNISKDTQTDSKLVTIQILKGLAKGPLAKWRPAITNVPARTKSIAISSLP
ncbi:MAG: N,N-dimethylformamidase beta subunit family domain-containing protein [Actinomycetes bacterium]